MCECFVWTKVNVLNTLSFAYAHAFKFVQFNKNAASVSNNARVPARNFCFRKLYTRVQRYRSHTRAFRGAEDCCVCFILVWIRVKLYTTSINLVRFLTWASNTVHIVYVIWQSLHVARAFRCLHFSKRIRSFIIFIYSNARSLFRARTHLYGTTYVVVHNYMISTYCCGAVLWPR